MSVVIALITLGVLFILSFRGLEKPKDQQTPEEEFEGIVEYHCRGDEGKRDKVIAALAQQGVTLYNIKRKRKESEEEITKMGWGALAFSLVFGMIFFALIGIVMRLAVDNTILMRLQKGTFTLSEATFGLQGFKILRIVFPTLCGAFTLGMGPGWGFYGATFALGGILSELFIVPFFMGW